MTSVAASHERLVVYALLGDDGRPTSWRIRLQTPTGTQDQPLHAGNVTSYPRAVAVVDVDRDGDPDWFVKARDYTSHGAPWAGMYLFVQDEDRISLLRYKDAPLVINFGGISRRGDGAQCDGGDLVLLRADARDPQNRTWSTVAQRFSLEGDVATLLSTHNGTLHISGYNDPDLDPYYEVECYGAHFGVFAPHASG